METYGEFAASQKLRSHLGGVEDKVSVAKASGSDKIATRKLAELLPSSQKDSGKLEQ